MNTVLMALVLTALLALVVRRLEVNHTRGAATPWGAPLGADRALDRDAERVAADTSVAAISHPARRRAVRPVARPHRPVGAPRAA
ncbi:hypothetical protein GCM10027446_14500 [Angustibacter peucedani]